MRLPKAFVAHPYLQFTRSRHFYAWYDGCYLAAAVAVLAVFWITGPPNLLGRPQWSWLAAAPMITMALIWCHLIIHNCVHGVQSEAEQQPAHERSDDLPAWRFLWAADQLRSVRSPDAQLLIAGDDQTSSPR